MPPCSQSQHRLHLLVVQRVEDFLDVAAEADGDGDRALVAAAVGVDVHQAGKQLVPVVERHPAAVEIEAGRADLAAHDLGEDFLAVDDGAVLALASEACDVAIALLGLNLGEFGDDIFGAALGFGLVRFAHRSTPARRDSGRDCGQQWCPLPSRHTLRLSASARRTCGSCGAGDPAPAATDICDSLPPHRQTATATIAHR